VTLAGKKGSIGDLGVRKLRYCERKDRADVGPEERKRKNTVKGWEWKVRRPRFSRLAQRPHRSFG